MTPNKTIEIPLSKSKLIKMLIGSIVFVLLGCWLMIYQPEISNPLLNNPVVKYGVGMASTLFFGFGVIYFSRKLADKKPGIIITESGLIDNSSAISAGHISWSDIKKLSTVKVMKQEFMIIEVSNPSHYINQQANLLLRKAMEYNYNNYGSPLTISANSLKCDLKELINLIENRLLEQTQKTKLVENMLTDINKDELIGE